MLVCPHLHHAAPHTLHSSVKYSFVQNRLKSAKLEENKLHKYCHASKVSENPLSYLYISRGVSTYLIPVSRTPDIHCHTSSLQSSGMELAWLDLTGPVILLNILVLLSSLSWESSNNSSTILVIQLGSYVRAKFSTIKIQDIIHNVGKKIISYLTHHKCTNQCFFYEEGRSLW